MLSICFIFFHRFTSNVTRWVKKTGLKKNKEKKKEANPFLTWILNATKERKSVRFNLWPPHYVPFVHSFVCLLVALGSGFNIHISKCWDIVNATLVFFITSRCSFKCCGKLIMKCSKEPKKKKGKKIELSFCTLLFEMEHFCHRNELFTRCTTTTTKKNESEILLL